MGNMLYESMVMVNSYRKKLHVNSVSLISDLNYNSESCLLPNISH